MFWLGGSNVSGWRKDRESTNSELIDVFHNYVYIIPCINVSKYFNILWNTTTSCIIYMDILSSVVYEKQDFGLFFGIYGTHILKVWYPVVPYLFPRVHPSLTLSLLSFDHFSLNAESILSSTLFSCPHWCNDRFSE